MPHNPPPNKCLKQGFVFLALVILGPKEPMKQINIFLSLLIKEMKELWQGVDAYDSHLKYRFNLRATYLWSIYDYLAHGKKVSFFDCHRRFLPSNHSFSNDTRSFLKGGTVRKGSPKRKFGADIIKMLDDLKELENGVFEGYSENHNWTHKSCLWELPYAKNIDTTPQN
jgi:hypothetical protein